jgi:hypothetical protein
LQYQVVLEPCVARWLDLRSAQVAALAAEGDHPASRDDHSQRMIIFSDRDHLWESLPANLPEVGALLSEVTTTRVDSRGDIRLRPP